MTLQRNIRKSVLELIQIGSVTDTLLNKMTNFRVFSSHLRCSPPPEIYLQKPFQKYTMLHNHHCDTQHLSCQSSIILCNLYTAYFFLKTSASCFISSFGCIV